MSFLLSRIDGDAPRATMAAAFWIVREQAHFQPQKPLR
jgi:hypothetical protein